MIRLNRTNTEQNKEKNKREQKKNRAGTTITLTDNTKPCCKFITHIKNFTLPLDNLWKHPTLRITKRKDIKKQKQQKQQDIECLHKRFRILVFSDFLTLTYGE